MKQLWAQLAAYQLRLLFRGVFLLLTLATLALALYMLQQEKQLGLNNYQRLFSKTGDQISSQLHHPTGQLALLNPALGQARNTGQYPMLLPFAALDFNDQFKVQQAVEMSGCLVQYEAYTSLCTAIGNNPWAGGFIYVAGSFASTRLVLHPHGSQRLDQAHRVRIHVSLRGRDYHWLAPFETASNLPAAADRVAHGRLTGFSINGQNRGYTRPSKDFRGWVWQTPQCLELELPTADCQQRAFFSVRLPVEVLHEELLNPNGLHWPPADLEQIKIEVEVLPPGNGPALLDNRRPISQPPFALHDLASLLLPGEALQIDRIQNGQHQPLLQLVGTEASGAEVSPILRNLIRQLPVEGYDQPLVSSERISTALGQYELRLTGDVRSINRTLAAVVTRVAGFVGITLLLIALAWLVIELSVIRRITLLTHRARAVSQTVRGMGDFDTLEVSDLRSRDELGVLAGSLADLLQRVREDSERERIRTEQEKDMWHAVGHEIMSPLQSLMALHANSDDDSHRYISRMQQAIRILYGSASPSEAFQSTTLDVQVLNLGEFLHHVAANAPCVGIEQVEFAGTNEAILVRADEYSLEDVVTHVLRNAARYRTPGTAITMTLDYSATNANVTIFNHGPAIADELIDKIFEYGVSDQQDAGANGNRGQGLFVAKTYMAKMAGTITVRNETSGVSFVLGLQRVSLS